jgi:PAS domain S-box-containing protein
MELDSNLRRVIDGIPEPVILTDRERRLLYFNEAYLALLGLRRRRVEAEIEKGAGADQFLQILESAGEASISRRSLETDRVIRFDEVRARCVPTQEELTIIVTAVPLEIEGKPIVLELYHDVSAEARVQSMYRTMAATAQERANQLDWQKEYAEAIFSGAPVALLVVAKGGTIASTNARFQQLFAGPGPSLEGRPIADVLPPLLVQQIHRMLEHDENPRRMEVTATVANRSPRVLDVSFARLPGADGSPNALISIDDVTELSLARDSALAASRTKSTFLANMSHELRTPLNAILGYAEMLVEDAEAGESLDRTGIEDLRKICTAGQHLLELINSILDLAKIEAGRMELAIESFDLATALDAIIGTIEPLATKSQSEIVRKFTSDLGEIRTDRIRLRQILLNLLGNACKFGPQGTITLSAERRVRDDRDRFLIGVSDTGVGIAPDKIEHLFQPFYQVDASTTRRFGGTGLGLAISQKFCEMMGGRIWAESQPSKGSTFWVELPAQIRTTTMDLAAMGHEFDGTSLSPSVERVEPNRTVLCIDDDPAVIDLVERNLKREGLTVLGASNAVDGIELARKVRPAVITLDVMMSGMDGWTALQKLKADPDLSSIPVVMLTIVSEKSLGFALGAADYITKPLNRAELIAVIRRFAVCGGAPILVVEDDPATMELICRTVEQEGYTTVPARNGRDALEELQHARPALVLLDLMMPEVDGFEVIANMREHETWRNVPVVVVTALDLREEDRQRLSGAVQKVILKGARPIPEILREILDWLRT